MKIAGPMMNAHTMNVIASITCPPSFHYMNFDSDTR
jgi:hypothetical protein